MKKKIVNNWTFFYNPHEITMNDKLRKHLEGFRTDDGETTFTLTMDDERLVIY